MLSLIFLFNSCRMLAKEEVKGLVFTTSGRIPLPFLSKEIMKLFNSCGGMMEVKKGANVKCVFYRGASVIYSLEHSH